MPVEVIRLTQSQLNGAVDTLALAFEQSSSIKNMALK